jgi:hypothetical protein
MLEALSSKSTRTFCFLVDEIRTMTTTMDLSNDGGVLKEILKEGTGEVPPDGYEIRGMLYEIPFT